MTEQKIRIRVTLDVTLLPDQVWPDALPERVTKDAVLDAMRESIGSHGAIDGSDALRILDDWGLADDLVLDVSIEKQASWRPL